MESRELINGVIARAQALYPRVRIYAFTFLSNHYHMLASCEDGAEFALFIGFVNSNIAREMGRLHGWRGALWGRRVRPIPILDHEALIGRLRYVLENGVKEGLVASPRDWPGASSTEGLLGSMTQRGIWVNRDDLRRARAGNPNADATPYTHTVYIRLSPIPAWQSLGPDALRRQYEALVVDIEREAAPSRTAISDTHTLLTQEPHAAPAVSAHRPAPLCHAASLAVREAYRKAYRAFVQAFRAAARRAAEAVAAIREFAFPDSSFPRPRWFCSSVNGVVANSFSEIRTLCPKFGRGTPE
jgi:hypothetical protein